MSDAILTILHQLGYDSLAELHTCKAQFLAERFDEAQLNRLYQALANHLRQNQIPIETRFNELKQSQLPLTVLGLPPALHLDLTNAGITTLTGFIQRDAVEFLTARWSPRDRLAVRSRILCLLTLSPQQIAELNPLTPPNPKDAGLEALGLPYKIYDALYEDGIKTVERLSTLSDKYLLKIPDIGLHSLAEIRQRLAAYLNIESQPTPSEPAKILPPEAKQPQNQQVGTVPSLPISPKLYLSEVDSSSSEPLIHHPPELTITEQTASAIHIAEPPEKAYGAKNTEVLNDPDGIEFEDSYFLHQPWLNHDWPDNLSLTYPDLIQFLYEDVCKLPIATSRRHEIWAGAQMKADERLKEIIDASGNLSPQQIFSKIYQVLAITWQKLESSYFEHQISLANLTPLWINEILTVRKNYYGTVRSHFRNSIKNIEASDYPPKAKEDITTTAFDLFELLWLLPDSALRFVYKRSQELNGVIPVVEDFEDWLKTYEDAADDLSVLKKQGLTARNKLVSGYFRAALKFARNYLEKVPNMDYLDLVQEGAVGLILAADRYEYRYSGRFITYATSWMWQNIGRASNELSRNIRIPVHRLDQLEQLEKVYQEAEIKDGIGQPEAKILSLELEFLSNEDVLSIRQHLSNGVVLSPKIKERWDKATGKTQRLLAYIEPTISLDIDIPAQLVKDDLVESIVEEDCSLFEVIYDKQGFLEDNLIIQEVNDFILDLCATLPARNRRIINLRFGLEDGQERTLEEVGQQLGLTRERIRQVEKKFFGHFNYGKQNRELKKDIEEYLVDLEMAKLSQHWPSQMIDYLNKYHSHWSKFDLVESSERPDWAWLDTLLEKLPGLEWHQRSPDISSRKTQVEDALKTLSWPSHYRNITEQLNDTLTEGELDENNVYSILLRYEDVFILLGEGVFSLCEWEQQRAAEPAPLLPFCPQPLPDLPGQIDTFLESVLVAQEYVNRQTGEFLASMLKWVSSETTPPNWLKQNILNAYYLVGLIPYTFHFQGHNPVLHSPLPHLTLPELRRYCLQNLTHRLTAMPEFWWIIRQYQPGTAAAIAEHFTLIHPLGLDDVANRLKLLTGLGATQRLPYNRYQLTNFGLALAREWAREPDFSRLETVTDSDSQTEDDFSILDLGLW